MLLFIIEMIIAIGIVIGAIGGCLRLTRSDTYKEIVCTKEQALQAAEMTKECFKYSNKEFGWEYRCQEVSTTMFCNTVVRKRKK